MLFHRSRNRTQPSSSKTNRRNDPPQSRAARLSRPRLQVEELETRTVLSGTWIPLVNAAPGPIGHIMLLSDGTIMAQNDNSADWMRLFPDGTGGYINGTWNNQAPMSEPRLYYNSEVLQDGRVFLIGGEYSGAGLPQNLTNTGEIYNPSTGFWTGIAPFPQANFGDDPGELLNNGQILLGYVFGPQTYLYNPATNTYTQTGTKLRGDASDEETWVKLPDDSILSYDIFSSIATGVGHAQRYIPSTGQWVDAGIVPVPLSSAAIGFELGPGLLLPNGLVLQLGGNSNTALYNPATNTWTAGPVIPNGMGPDDAPAAILPNGDVIFVADKPLFNPPAQIFDYDYRTNTITAVPTPPVLANELAAQPSFPCRMLVLPSGDLLLAVNTFTESQGWIYHPNGGPLDSWRPTITNITNQGNNTFYLTGTQLTGISEGSNYGDDDENATNYPIVRITDSTGKVLYARTFDWSSTGVAKDGEPQSTFFNMPAGLASGPLSVVVIANGIPSQPFIIPFTVPTATYYPFRYVFNARTHLFSGNLTVRSTYSQVLEGKFLILFPDLPPGVTLANEQGTIGGVPFIAVNSVFAPSIPLRVRISLRNPLHVPMSTFYIGFPVLVLQDSVGTTVIPDPPGGNPFFGAAALLPPKKRPPLFALAALWQLQQSDGML